MPASAVDVVRIAFDHTTHQLFKPFRLGQWTRLAVAGLLAGELTSGGCGVQIPSMPGRGAGSRTFLAQALPLNPRIVVGITLLVIVGLALILAFMYINSVMRFVLFDSVVTKECHIRRFWAERHQAGLRYFLWQLLFTFLLLSGIAALTLPALILGFGLGWFQAPREHLLPLILGGVILFVAFALLLIGAVIISVLTKDFVVPQMAFEGIDAMEGWSRLWRMLQEEKAAYAGYVGLKILLSIGGMAALAAAALIVILVFAIPVGVLGLAAFLAAKTLGLAWNLATISVVVILGAVVLAALIYALILVSVPVIVFFPAYSIHFFAERYAPLRSVL
jgi:hypothetical protein